MSNQIPIPVDDVATAKTSEAHSALMTDMGRLVDTVLTLKDLILAFDDRLNDAQREIRQLKERLTGVELLQLQDGMRTRGLT